jgi:hypothetical protein
MTAELHTALAKANLFLTNPGKDGKGNYGAFLTLDALLEHVRKPLATQGLSLVQDVILDGDRVQIVTQLLHSSGESIVFGPLSGPAGANWQQLGGAITYARRYALMAALGIAGGDDDDAQAHTDANPQSTVVRHTGPLGAAEARKNLGPATTKQVGFVAALMKAQGLNEIALNTLSTSELGFEMPTEGLSKLTFDQASKLITRMQKAGEGVTRTKSTRDDDDPWANIPVTGPDGEVLI